MIDAGFAIVNKDTVGTVAGNYVKLLRVVFKKVQFFWRYDGSNKKNCYICNQYQKST